MEEFKVLEKRSIILYMKVNSKMIFIMAMVDIFILMEIIILVIGWMEKDLDGEGLLISLVKFMKECGVIVNLWEAEYFKLYLYLILN
jgi:hypothetical protein